MTTDVLVAARFDDLDGAELKAWVRQKSVQTSLRLAGSTMKTSRPQALLADRVPVS